MSDSKKMTKGSVAIAAGVVLLLGGAGTYALWEVSQPLDGSVAVGDLNLELGDGTWTLNGATVANPESVRIVPGDEVSLEQNLTVTAIGDDLFAQLSVNENEAFIPADLDEFIDVTFDLDADWAEGEGNNTYLVEAGTEPYAATATVTVNFAASTPGREGVNSTLDLNELEFSLEQLPRD